MEFDKTPIPAENKIPDLQNNSDTIMLPAKADKLKNLTLPKIKDPRQKKAGFNILVFFALILIFTFIARGTRGAAMAVVNTVTPTSGEIVEKINARASVFAQGETEITPPAENLTIEEIFASNGKKLTVGDELLRFSQTETDEAIARREAELAELELKHKTALRGEKHDSSILDSALTGLERERQNYENEKRLIENSLNTAKEQFNNAQNYVLELESLLAAIPDDEDNIEEKANTASLLENARVQLEDARQSLAQTEQQAESDKTRIKQSLEDAEKSYSNAQENDNVSRQETADRNEQSKITATTLELDINNKKKELEKLYEIKNNNYTLKSPISGVLNSIANKGDKSTALPVASISNTAQGYIAKTAISKKQAELINVGDSCNISVSGSSMFSNSLYSGTVKSLKPSEDGSDDIEIEIALPDDAKWTIGQSVEIQIILNRENHSLTLPISALHTDNSGYFLLLLNEESTVLGTENIVYRVPVNVLCKDENNAAVEGMISPYDKIIKSADKIINEGDVVRLND